MLRSVIRRNIDETGGKSGNASRPSVMVCLSPSPSNKRVIRTAARMAFSGMPQTAPSDIAVATADTRDTRAAGEDVNLNDSERITRAYDPGHKAAFICDRPPIALYVGATGHEADNDSLLRENIRYAREYGFELHMVRGTDIPLAIAEFARREGVTDLFLGYSPPSFILLPKPAINEKLLSYLPTVDIHIVPDPVSSPYPKTIRKTSSGPLSLNPRDLLLVLAVMAVATLLSCWFYMSRFSNSNIITIYILGVLIASVLTSSRVYGTFAAVLYVLLFNFLFIEPRFTLLVYDSAYMMTYLVTVIAALITGTVAIRMKNIAHVSAENAYQAKILLDTSNRLESAAGSGEIIRTTCRQLVHLLNRSIVYYPPSMPRGYSRELSGDTLSDSSGYTDPDRPYIFPAGEKKLSGDVLEKELEAVRWSMENSHNAGAFTSHFSDCTCRYLSIYSGKTKYGVIGIDMEGHSLTEFESTILLSIIHECTMELENERMAQEQQKAEIRAENERLRAGLLRSISHDLRTPLTSIYGNACNLHRYEEDLPREERSKIYEDIMEDAEWLSAQFENILAMTRLESGPGIRRTAENMEDVIEQSLRHVPSRHNHRIILDTPDSEDQIFFAEMEPRLIMQVLINILNNAVKYTPDGSEIHVRMERSGDQIIVDVADNGPGIPDADKPYVFDLFYNGRKRLTDSYRSMGIGLNLCAEILRAHGGDIEILDNEPAGALFRFRLPAADLDTAEIASAAADFPEPAGASGRGSV